MTKKTPRVRRTLTPQFKRDAVALLLRGRSVNEVAHALGVARSLLQRWRTRLDRQAEHAFPEGLANDEEFPNSPAVSSPAVSRVGRLATRGPTCTGPLTLRYQHASAMSGRRVRRHRPFWKGDRIASLIS